MVTFDGVLNIVIPTGVVIVFGFIILNAMKEPLGGLLSAIKRGIGLFRKGDDVEDYSGGSTVAYE